MSSERKEITLNIDLPHEFRIVRYGDTDTLELESKEFDYDRKTKKKLKTKSWKFLGYFSSVDGAIRGYIKFAPAKRMVGNKTVQDYKRFLRDIEKEINKIVKE